MKSFLFSDSTFTKPTLVVAVAALILVSARAG